MSIYPEEFKALEEENEILTTALQEISDTEDEYLECGCGYAGYIDKIAKQALKS